MNLLTKKWVGFFLVGLLALSNPVLSNSRINSGSLKIALFGDSLVFGYGLNQADNLSSQLQKIFASKENLNIEVINYGISGDTTSSALSRVDWLINEIKPNIVFLAIGANDMLRGINPQLVEDNLNKIIKQLKQNQIKVILSKVISLSNMGADYQMKFNQIYPNLIKKYKIESYPFILNNIYNQPDLMQKDGMHPNKKGVKQIASLLAQFLIRFIN